MHCLAKGTGWQVLDAELETSAGYSLSGPLCLPQAPSTKLFIKKKKIQLLNIHIF